MYDRQNLDLALAYAKFGLKVYPVYGINDNKCLCNGMPNCRPGKHPFSKAVPHGSSDASCDETVIRKWFPTKHVNVGINVSASGLLVIDFDVGKGGMETLKQWESEYGAMPLTPTVQSGSKGRHYYFKAHPLITHNDNTTLQGVDIVANGGVIAPPSMHECGERYIWLTPLETPLVDCPDWLVKLIAQADKPKCQAGQENPMQGHLTHSGVTFETLGSLPSGERNAEVNRCVGSMVKAGYTSEQILDAGTQWAEKQEPPYSINDLRQKVKDFARKEEAKGVSIIELSGDLADACEVKPFNEFANSPIRSFAEPINTQHPVMQEAYHGLIGETLKAIEPQTEADPAGLLFALLTSFGSAVGHKPYIEIGARRHYANIFVCLHGKTGCLKGEPWHVCRSLFASQEDWLANCLGSHFGSGEGLVERICDESIIQDKGKDVILPGIADKRLMIIDSEFRNTLTLCRRPDSTLGGFLLKAWDGDALQVMNRQKNALRATDHHISILGNITTKELSEALGRGAEAFNGFGNRFLWINVKRSKIITFPKAIEFYDLQERWAFCFAVAKQIERMHYDQSFERLYEELCPLLIADAEDETLRANVLERSRPYVFRLAMLYALAAGAASISREHLQAAYACWRINVEGCRAVFIEGVKRKTHSLTERLLNLLRERAGLSRTQIHDAFNRKLTGDALGEALNALEANDLIYSRMVEKVERWYPTDSDKRLTGVGVFNAENAEANGELANSAKSEEQQFASTPIRQFANSVPIRSFAEGGSTVSNPPVEPLLEKTPQHPVERSTQENAPAVRGML